MSSHQMRLMQERNAFRPSPRLDQLADLHVPFDELTGAATCEQPLHRALQQGHRVALVGASGAGKSSVAEHTLGPLVEGFAPMRVPVSMERPEVATDPAEFARHLIALVQRWISAGLPAADKESRELTRNQRATQSTKRFSVTPEWLTAKVELAYELGQAAADPSPTSLEVIDQARSLIDVVRVHDLQPVVVLDDTDRWLATSWQPDATTVRSAFFGRIVRVLAEDLDTAAVIAAHPTYLADPGYQDAGGFIDTTLHVPPVPHCEASTTILTRRAGLAFGQALEPDEVISPRAAEAIFQRYGQAPNIRKHLLLVAGAALTFAVDDDAQRIQRRHVVAALAQETAEGP